MRVNKVGRRSFLALLGLSPLLAKIKPAEFSQPVQGPVVIEPVPESMPQLPTLRDLVVEILAPDDMEIGDYVSLFGRIQKVSCHDVDASGYSLARAKKGDRLQVRVCSIQPPSIVTHWGGGEPELLFIYDTE